MPDISAAGAAVGVDLSAFSITELTLDSRAVTPGSAFIAIKGHAQNGADYIEQALAKGASLILVDRACGYHSQAQNIIEVDRLKLNLAKLSAAFYGHASRQFSLVGVTGTNGKSTVANMIANLSCYCQQSASVIGTLGYGQPNNLTALANTTPSTVELQRLFNNFAQSEKLVAMEVSSHGLEQGRVDYCDFDVAIFTNLSRDHLDYHGTMAHYANAKKRLFTDHFAKHCIINIDDSIGRQWAQQASLSGLVVYGHNIAQLGYQQFVSFEDVSYLSTGITTQLNTSWGKVKLFIPLFGLFNLYNLAAAFAALLTLGYDFNQLCHAVEKLQPVAGRMEPFSATGYPTCIVDYAHTPDALEQALFALTKHAPNGITCVFGCGGDRDRGKRPLMASAAEKYATKVIVTNDNPRTENEKSISDDIIAGFTKIKPQIELDRATAIAHAIEITDKDNLVLVAGKGHEDYQVLADQVIKFSDRDIVKNNLKGRAE